MKCPKSGLFDVIIVEKQIESDRFTVMGLRIIIGEKSKGRMLHVVVHTNGRVDG